MSNFADALDSQLKIVSNASKATCWPTPRASDLLNSLTTQTWHQPQSQYSSQNLMHRK